MEGVQSPKETVYSSETQKEKDDWMQKKTQH